MFNVMIRTHRNGSFTMPWSQEYDTFTNRKDAERRMAQLKRLFPSWDVTIQEVPS